MGCLLVSTEKTNLVDGLDLFLFSIQLGISSSQLTNSMIFQRDSNHQPATVHLVKCSAHLSKLNKSPGSSVLVFLVNPRLEKLGSWRKMLISLFSLVFWWPFMAKVHMFSEGKPSIFFSGPFRKVEVKI